VSAASYNIKPSRYSLLGRTDKIVKKINISFVRKVWKWKYREVLTSEVISECKSYAADLYEDGARGGSFGWGTALQARRSLKIFIDIILSARTMSLASTRPRTEMNTRNRGGGEVKAADASCWRTYHLPVPIVLKSGGLSHLEPSGSVQACTRIALPLPVCMKTIPKSLHYWNALDWKWTVFVTCVLYSKEYRKVIYLPCAILT
jgi:hypothetical protein